MLFLGAEMHFQQNEVVGDLLSVCVMVVMKVPFVGEAVVMCNTWAAAAVVVHNLRTELSICAALLFAGVVAVNEVLEAVKFYAVTAVAVDKRLYAECVYTDLQVPFHIFHYNNP